MDKKWRCLAFNVFYVLSVEKYDSICEHEKKKKKQIAFGLLLPSLNNPKFVAAKSPLETHAHVWLRFGRWLGTGEPPKSTIQRLFKLVYTLFHLHFSFVNVNNTKRHANFHSVQGNRTDGHKFEKKTHLKLPTFTLDFCRCKKFFFPILLPHKMLKCSFVQC